MTLGAMAARYMKVFKSAVSAWFYLHVACQSSAYVVGVAGWTTGIKLGSDSPRITYTPHRTIGIILFCFGTLQLFALLMRPNKDRKYRLYWNIHHHSFGYSVIILSIVGRELTLGSSYFFGVLATFLEAFTWFIVIKWKKTSKQPHTMNGGANGVNGHGYGATAMGQRV
ncbi:hypothetical protein like AT4G17280 [Hibiscus trionum]|uniref:Cytochrome b561 domain-containing protein n=1 Tax=Hibiscus trionum TaxID=183268 RepID=A0A9W7I550_HIBTR|nr:hypothetical protein like AT4G17280 [Hibiscus trionum]